MPERELALRHWLEQGCGIAGYELTPASADASFRRYFRVTLADGSSLVAMDAPPEKEDCAPFVEITDRLSVTGVHVPKIHAKDLHNGFLLLEDLGHTLYLDVLDGQTVDQLYQDAIAALLRLQVHADTQGLPIYDRTLLQREMDLFPEWLLRRHLGLRLSDKQLAMLDQVFDYLIEQTLSQPRVLVHRDYHSRNLLVCDDANPGIIDYQDAVFGPISYDLVSLLRDCYIRWPLEQVTAWVAHYTKLACVAGLISREQQAQMPVWFDLMGVQRHLKAAGIFARLNHRDGKSGYLADIPRTLAYIVEVAEHRPEIAPLGELIQALVLPKLSER